MPSPCGKIVLPAPFPGYNRENEAQTRRLIELFLDCLSQQATTLARFEFLCEWGVNGSPPVVGEVRARMFPRNADLFAWFARLDIVGNATWNVYHANGISGSVSPVGGTQPFVNSAIGHGNNPLDWGTTSGVLGDVLILELATIDPGVEYAAVSVLCQG